MEKNVFKTIMVYVIALLGCLPAGLFLWLFGYIMIDKSISLDISMWETRAILLLFLVFFCAFLSSIMMLCYYHKVNCKKYQEQDTGQKMLSKIGGKMGVVALSLTIAGLVMVVGTVIWRASINYDLK